MLKTMDGTQIRPVITYSCSDSLVTKEEVTAAAAGFVLLILINLRRLIKGGKHIIVMKRSLPDRHRRPPSPIFEDAVQSLDELHALQQQQDQQQCGFKFAAPQMPECLRQQPQSDQQRAEQDLIGINAKDDDVEMDLFDKVQELEGRIQAIENKPAYDMAMEMNPEYPRTLMVPFLRSVDGSAKKASKRLVRHFETKLDLFGPDKLVRPIELNDLSEGDWEAMNSGGFQVLPKKDRAGRPLLFGRYTAMRYPDMKNMFRVLFYIWMTIIEDEDHQKKGVVAIGFENGKLPLQRLDSLGDVDDDQSTHTFDMFTDEGFDRDLARGVLMIPLSVPARPMAYHICSDRNRWESVFDMVLSTLCKYVRLRLRMHYGTMQENKYAMMTHGIPGDVIPVTREGEIELTNHQRWIEHRRQLEEARRETGKFIPSNWAS